MTEYDSCAGLIESICFLAAADLLIERDALEAEANRVERWNAPWARNRRRKAARLLKRAKRLAGDGGLPWGVQDE